MEQLAAGIDLIMSELGPASPDVAAIAREGDSSWTLLLEDGSAIHAATREHPRRLELIVHVGALPAKRTAEVLRGLMMFNLLGGDTGGARLGVSALDDTVFLMRDLPQAALTTLAVQSELVALGAAAGTWREFLLAAAAQTDLPPLPVDVLSHQV